MTSTPTTAPPLPVVWLQAKQEEDAKRAADEGRRKEETRLKREQEAAQRRWVALNCAGVMHWSAVHGKGDRSAVLF